VHLALRDEAPHFCQRIEETELQIVVQAQLAVRGTRFFQEIMNTV